MNYETDLADMIVEKLMDLATPGFIAEMTPLEADMMGAFFEDALSEEDAREAVYD